VAKGWPVEPVDAVRRLFYGFKVLQAAVFVGWCWVFGHGTLWPIAASPAVAGLGLLSIAVGQALNFSVFHRLGRVGVFYGDRFGYVVPWYCGFPFSISGHPQYLGTVLTIWGCFLVMRFPHADWYVLPALETAYYAISASFERQETDHTSDRETVRRA
jgi:hypothetical protein